jgi:hypothetical protein
VWPGDMAPEGGHLEAGESGCRRSGTDNGFSWPLSLCNDECASVVGSWALLERGGAAVRVGVLGPPILERSCLS